MDINLQPRDIVLLRGLFESRIATLTHLSKLHFDGKAESTKKRLQKLKSAGFVGERARKVSDPSILYLTKKAFEFLDQNGHLCNYPKLTWAQLESRVQVSLLTIRHELEVMDVKSAFAQSLRVRDGFSLAEFSTWPRLSEFPSYHPTTGTKITVKPDGFIRIREQDAEGLSEHLLFFELDRSTESQSILATRTQCYLDFYKQGGMAVRHGEDRSKFRDFPFRVLIVCKTAERRNNLAHSLLSANPPIRTFAWLSTVTEVTADPLGSVWLTPEAYEVAVRHTPYAVERSRTDGGYRRQDERENLIKRNVKLVPLFEP